MAKMIADSWVTAQSDNLPRAIRFYAKLGLKPSKRIRGHYVEFKAPGGTVLSFYQMGKQRVKRSSGGWQIMLRVKDIKAVEAGLKRGGVRCTPIASPGDARLSWFLDPDGNRLVLIQFGR